MALDVNKVYGWGVLGCGWLGQAWLRSEFNAEGPSWGTARSRDTRMAIAKTGAEAIPFDAGADPDWRLLPPCQHLLVAWPPSAGEPAFERAASWATDKDWTVLISSTSAYPDAPGLWTEDQAVRRISPHSGMCLLDLEAPFRGERTTILRCGGLFGPGRHPGRFLRGRPLVRPEEPVNMVHQSDVVRAIHHVTTHRLNGVFNLVSPEPVSRLAFYSAAGAVDHPIHGPATHPSTGRRISSEAILTTGFSFQYPNPIQALASFDDPLPRTP